MLDSSRIVPSIGLSLIMMALLLLLAGASAAGVAHTSGVSGTARAASSSTSKVVAPEAQVPVPVATPSPTPREKDDIVKQFGTSEQTKAKESHGHPPHTNAPASDLVPSESSCNFGCGFSKFWDELWGQLKWLGYFAGVFALVGLVGAVERLITQRSPDDHFTGSRVGDAIVMVPAAVVGGELLFGAGLVVLFSAVKLVLLMRTIIAPARATGELFGQAAAAIAAVVLIASPYLIYQASALFRAIAAVGGKSSDKVVL